METPHHPPTPTTYNDEEVQTLSLIMIPEGVGKVPYNFTCRVCERDWLLTATIGSMYEGREKIGNENITIALCFDCAIEALQTNTYKANIATNWSEKEAWVYSKVLIRKFCCCYCGKSCDTNYKVSDGFRGKIPFYKYVFQTAHKFCYLCYHKVKRLPAQDNSTFLNPSTCSGDHSTTDPLDNISV